MSYTDEMHKNAVFGDLYELTLEEAATKIYEGLWDSTQATIEDITRALYDDVQNEKLKIIRGSARQIGGYSSNPAILNAFDVAVWAEKNGLELESNGGWSSYIHEESEIACVLHEKLEALRALQQDGRAVSEILEDADVKADNQRDVLLKYMAENQELRNRLGLVAGEDQKIKSNSKSIVSVCKMLSAMAVKGYGYRPEDKKSPIPSEITQDIETVLGETLDVDTVRKWLKSATDQYPPKNNG